MLRRAFLKAVTGVVTAAVGVRSWAGNGLTFRCMTVTATDASWLERRRWDVDEVAMAFQPTYVGTERLDGVDWHLWDVSDVPKH